MENIAVTTWKRKTKRKADKFYLYKHKNIVYTTTTTKIDENGVCIPQNGFVYYVMYKENSTGNVKYVTFKDGMYCRYGMNTLAVQRGSEYVHLWQSTIGIITQEEHEVMLRLYNYDEINYPLFDLDILKDLVH